MDSHDGIQKLLAAEQEAQAIVTAARAVETDYGVLAQDGHMSVEGLCELWESFD